MFVVVVSGIINYHCFYLTCECSHLSQGTRAAMTRSGLICATMCSSLSFLGPLVCEKDDRWYLVGTTSWGWGCAGQYYGVYTNIAELYNWIKTNML